MAVQDIWLLPLPDMPFEQLLEREGHVMTTNEHAQLVNKRLPKGKHMYAFTRIALRHVLSRYETHVAPGQWRFLRQGAGKPTIAEPESSLHFNLTHADDLLVIAVCDHAEVGVDVEDKKRDVDVLALSHRYYQANEVSMLERHLDPEKRRIEFLTLWTLKEAAVKATGKGLSKALRDFSFNLLPPNRIEVKPGEAGKVSPAFWTFAWRDYLLSTAKLTMSGQIASLCSSALSDANTDASDQGDETRHVAGWRCFCWEWPEIHPTIISPELCWQTID